MKSRTSAITTIGGSSTLALVAFVGLLASGCAVSGSGPATSRRQASSTVVADPVFIPSPSASPTPTPTASPIPVGTDPLYSYSVRATGYATTLTLQVPVNKVLKMRFTPGEQDRTVANTGFSPTYSKLAVYLTVAAQVQPTPLLSNGLATPLQSSPILDFSRAYTKTCATTDPACRQYVTVTISKPNNDYFCYNFGTYCPYAQMYSTHPWNGVLELQTDDTVALQ